MKTIMIQEHKINITSALCSAWFLFLWCCILTFSFPPLPAAAGPEEFTFVQLCDPQLGMTDYKEDICSLEQTVKQINILNPGFLLICGDFVNSPNKTSLPDFRKIMEPLAVQCHYVPGNHDLPLSTNTAILDRYHEFFGKDHYTFSKGLFRFVVCNTQLLKSPVKVDNRSHILWIEEELKDAEKSGLIPVLAGHHPPFYMSPGEPDVYQNMPTEQRLPLLALCSQYHVQAYLSGHTHHFATHQYGEMNIVSGEATSTNIDGHPLGFRLWKAGNTQLVGHTFIPLYKRAQISPKPAYNPESETGAVARCLANLRLLDAVKETVAMRRQMPNGATISEEELYQKIKGGKASVVCPDGGTYRINPLGKDPECSLPAHRLPYFYQYEEFKKRSQLQGKLREKIFCDIPSSEISKKGE